MHHSVEDRICQRRVLHHTVPLVNLELAYQDGAALPVAAFGVLQQVIKLCFGQRLKTQNVQYQPLCFLQHIKMLCPIAVNALLHKTPCTPVLVMHALFLPTSMLTQRICYAGGQGGPHKLIKSFPPAWCSSRRK